MKSMDEAHRRDYAEKHQMDDLRHQITAILADPPTRLWPATRAALEQSRDQLQKQSDHVVAVWD